MNTVKRHPFPHQACNLCRDLHFKGFSEPTSPLLTPLASASSARLIQLGCRGKWTCVTQPVALARQVRLRAGPLGKEPLAMALSLLGGAAKQVGWRVGAREH